MPSLALLSHFFGDVFLTNALPQCVSGMLGRLFRTPFAKPASEGLSSTVNVLWGMCNIVAGYVLVCRVGDLRLRNTADVLACGAGAFLTALFSARPFGRHGGSAPEQP